MRRRAARAAIMPCWLACAGALLLVPWPLVLSAGAVAALALAVLVRP